MQVRYIQSIIRVFVHERLKPLTQTLICRYTSCHADGLDAQVFGATKRLLAEGIHHGALTGGGHIGVEGM